MPPVSASGAALDNSLDHHRAAEQIPARSLTAPSKLSGSELPSCIARTPPKADALRRPQRPARWRRLVLFAAISDDVLRRHQQLFRDLAADGSLQRLRIQLETEDSVAGMEAVNS